ncbi:hypothetical protein cypCar_00021422 [Cyprinus carpio]|nr:hypothetical protein cypCar_00021422 [Cyprinus carpio]
MTLNEKSVQNTITQPGELSPIVGIVFLNVISFKANLSHLVSFNRTSLDMDRTSGTLTRGSKFSFSLNLVVVILLDSPQVMFTGDNIPVHPHVYSNGHICLSILTEDWSPALSVQSVCLSIISMLSSCKEKRRPPDNSFYVRTCNKNPKKTKWWYHDDTC